MAKLSDLETNNNFKILLYGDSGTSKTCFSAGFPKPIHYFDFDNKVSSAAKFLKGQGKSTDGITYDTCDASNAGQIIKTINELASLKGDFPYKTVVLDSLTTFSDAMSISLIFRVGKY